MNASQSRARALNVLASRLVDKRLDKAHIEKLADVVLAGPSKVVRIDPCIYGICIDHIFPKLDDIRIKDLIELSPGRIRNIDILIDGIVDPEVVRVRVGQEMF